MIFLFQAEDGIRDLVRSRGLGDVYKRQVVGYVAGFTAPEGKTMGHAGAIVSGSKGTAQAKACLLYTSDAADERSSVDLGGRRIIKKKNHDKKRAECTIDTHTRKSQ